MLTLLVIIISSLFLLTMTLSLNLISLKRLDRLKDASAIKAINTMRHTIFELESVIEVQHGMIKELLDKRNVYNMPTTSTFNRMIGKINPN